VTEGDEKLSQDVRALSAMAAEMEDYLDSDVLFWQMASAGLPKLTLGGYLMRQKQLLALYGSLSPDQQAEVDTAVARFNKALEERIVRFEQKAHRELEARLRQWEEYLKDVERGQASSKSNFSTAVGARAMIAALTDYLQLAPYQLDNRFVQRTALLDNRLRQQWQTGDFVWPETLEEAYPKKAYWWLYGQPREKE
jgi:HPt (histidine-containing phosphotransfer) domain-containing protein